MKKLKFTGVRYIGNIAFMGPGELIVGEGVSDTEADRLCKDFPDRFSIVDDMSDLKDNVEKMEPIKKRVKELQPIKTREMRPKRTK